MRKVRDILRLAVGQGLSRRQVGASLGIPHTTVADHLHRAEAAGLGWPLPEGMSDAELEAALFPRVPVAPPPDRPMPDWRQVHKELRRKGVTLMLLWLEYKEANPEGGYSYSQFCPAPRGALTYPLHSGEGLEVISLGPMADLDSKDEGDNSMPLTRLSCPGVWGEESVDPRDTAKA